MVGEDKALKGLFAFHEEQKKLLWKEIESDPIKLKKVLSDMQSYHKEKEAWREELYGRVITGPLRDWRAANPDARVANIAGRGDLVDVDFAFLHGVKCLNMQGCTGVTDVAFRHIAGVEWLDMSGCSQPSVTGFEALRGVKTLDISQCNQRTITDGAFVHLAGALEVLTMGYCDQHTITGSSLWGLMMDRAAPWRRGLSFLHIFGCPQLIRPDMPPCFVAPHSELRTGGACGAWPPPREALSSTSEEALRRAQNGCVVFTQPPRGARREGAQPPPAAAAAAAGGGAASGAAALREDPSRALALAMVWDYIDGASIDYDDSFVLALQGAAAECHNSARAAHANARARAPSLTQHATTSHAHPRADCLNRSWSARGSAASPLPGGVFFLPPLSPGRRASVGPRRRHRRESVALLNLANVSMNLPHLVPQAVPGLRPLRRALAARAYHWAAARARGRDLKTKKPTECALFSRSPVCSTVETHTR